MTKETFPRLTGLRGLPATVAVPGFDRTSLRQGILHLGPGAFFRAHLAVHNDAAIAATGGDWGILVAGLRNDKLARSFDAQNGLCTVVQRDSDSTSAQVLGSILGGVAPEQILRRMTDPAIRIVSLTITEKGYGLNPVTGGLDPRHPSIAPDLAAADRPQSAVGLITAGLAQRRAAGWAPFTPLSCDNLPGNGQVLRKLVTEFAARQDAELADWIATYVPFPSTMVDRITPASTDETLADAARLTSREDALAVETEPFSQWVIEDDFTQGRPDWDRGGALFVRDVAPYEKMKLRMLNGTHSLLAWLGLAAGHVFVRDAIADPVIAAEAQAHLAEAAQTLDPVPGVDPVAYAKALIARFENRAIAHRLIQIATDSSQKLPPRILAPAVEMLAQGKDADRMARATAAWMRHAATIRPLPDPRAAEIEAVLAGGPADSADLAKRLMALPGLFPPALAEADTAKDWRDCVASHLTTLCRN